MAQSQREAAINEFRNGATRILITTDMFSSPYHFVAQISLIVNYDLPWNKENYIARGGRSGKFGRRYNYCI